MKESLEKIGLIVLLVFLLSGIEAVSKAKTPQRELSELPKQTEYSPVLETGEIFSGTEIPVLMYHHVGYLPPRADRIRRDLTVSPENFAQQIQYLKDNGYTAITTEDLIAFAKEGKTLPNKPIVLTFDDGYADVMENAVPVLATNGMKGSFAIITGLVGTTEYANWEQIKEALAQGMEILPHTRSHMDFENKRYTRDKVFEDIQGSLHDLKNNLGLESKTFVFPFGNYSQMALDVLKEVGIELAFTTKNGFFETANDMLLQPRVRIHGAGDLNRFANSLD